GVPGEQVMATQTKRLASGAVGSIASNVLIDEYDMNPYIAMGIGMGISGLTYRGINSIEVDTTMGITASGGKEVNGVEDIKEISKVEKLTSNSVKKIINDNDMTVDEFSKLLDPDKVLTPYEQEIVNKIRQQIGIPKKGTVMTKIIPEADIEKYLNENSNDRYEVKGFVSVDEHSKSLKKLKSVYEGNRLDYKGTKFKVNCEVNGKLNSSENPNKVYGKINYKLYSPSEVKVPEDIATPENYPYTGKGFTGSKNIVLPELKQVKRDYMDGDILSICEAKTGKVIQQFRFDELKEDWIKIK
ncbi:MAG TPA: hypothetical protein VK071_11680, partial [Tissierellales bacterium]|nr:hypothetical protein [Tissierellales bacterium]